MCPRTNTLFKVFKLKGADRKHKQDREKLAKRPDSEREKFCPQYDCTMLSDLSVDSIYIPATMSPAQSEPDLANLGRQGGAVSARIFFICLVKGIGN